MIPESVGIRFCTVKPCCTLEFLIALETISQEIVSSTGAGATTTLSLSVTAVILNTRSFSDVPNAPINCPTTAFVNAPIAKILDVPLANVAEPLNPMAVIKSDCIAPLVKISKAGSATESSDSIEPVMSLPVKTENEGCLVGSISELAEKDLVESMSPETRLRLVKTGVFTTPDVGLVCSATANIIEFPWMLLVIGVLPL